MYVLSYQRKSDGKGTQAFLKLERQYFQRQIDRTPLSYQRKSDKESAQTFFKPVKRQRFLQDFKSNLSSYQENFEEENIWNIP